jgi:hypothetical protein
MTDPILRELWTVKDGLAAERGHDLRRLFDKLKAAQATQPRKIINRVRQRPAASATR